jgi:hypothetical protein
MKRLKIAYRAHQPPPCSSCLQVFWSRRCAEERARALRGQPLWCAIDLKLLGTRPPLPTDSLEILGGLRRGSSAREDRTS